MNVNNFELIEIMSSYDINDYIENCEKYKCILRFFSGSCYLLKINNSTIEMKEICKIIQNEIIKNIDYYIEIYENKSKLKNSDLRNYQENHIDEFDILVNYDLRCIDVLNNLIVKIYKEYNIQNFENLKIMSLNAFHLGMNFNFETFGSDLSYFKYNLIEKKYILEDVSKIPEKYKSLDFPFLDRNIKNKISKNDTINFYMRTYELLRIMLKNNILKKITLNIDDIFYAIFLQNIHINSKFNIFEDLSKNTSLTELNLTFDFTEKNLLNQSIHFLINELKNNKSITSIEFDFVVPLETDEITINIILDLLEVNNSINKITIPFCIYSEKVYNRFITILESNKFSFIHFNNFIHPPFYEYFHIFNKYLNENNVKLICSISQLTNRLL